jgi:glutamine synthetase
MSDMTLKPVLITPDPFNPGPHVLALCEVYDLNGKPAATNHRARAQEAIEKVKNEEPWFGMEQEFTLLQQSGRPLGWPEQPHQFPGPQGPYYCAHGASRAFGRDIVDAHLYACLYAGIKNTGTNAEVMPGQWEYQIGPGPDLEVGDHLWLSRYILERMAETFGADVSLDPKPVPGNWNGTGNHCNFSTKSMRMEGGLEVMKQAMGLFERRHMDHIRVYDPNDGEDNKRRLTGLHETAPLEHFSWGIGDRSVSIRIPRPIAERGYGWLEDRRPSANCDPYAVIDRIIRTVCLKE